MVEFGEKLKQIREEKGMTQQTLAEKLHVTRQAVPRWEWQHCWHIRHISGTRNEN